MIEYKIESWATLQNEGLLLLDKHYKEVAHYPDIKLDPDHEMYLKIESIGGLRVFTARDEANVLIGYAVFFIKHNLHYKASLQAVQDIIFIEKERRGFGAKFISWCDDQLRVEGIQVVYHHVKTAINFGPLLERQGYELIDLIYGKRLDGSN